MNIIKEEVLSNKWLIILSVLTGISASMITIVLITIVTSSISSGTASSSSTLIFITLLFFLLVCTYVSEWYTAKFTANFVYRLRLMLAEYFMMADYEHIERELGGKVAASLALDISQVSNGFSVLPGLMIRVITICFGMAVLLYQSPKLFLLFSLALIVCVSISYIGSLRVFKGFFELREHGDKLFSLFRTMSDGAKELNMDLGRKKFFYNQEVRPCLSEARVKELFVNKSLIFIQTWGTSSLFLVIGVVVYSGLFLLDLGVAVTSSFVMLSLYLMQPISYILSSITPVITCKNSLNKLSALKIYAKERGNQTNLLDKLALCPEKGYKWSRIEAKEITYHYPNSESEFCVGPVNLKVNRGEVIILEGGNGAGKSSILKILLGLYKPSSGAVFVDGKEIEGTDDPKYKAIFGSVLSDYFLFNHVLDEYAAPIATGRFGGRLEELELSKKISIVDGQIETNGLSQGQRKRLALFMLYARNNDLFVLDEWAADQDPQYRRYFYEQIVPELKAMGKTVIMVSHDERYFYVADKIYRVEEGKIVSSNFESVQSASSEAY